MEKIIKKKTKVVVIASGKGGVGKTTTSAAISFALAEQGFKTVVIDFDVGLRNLDLVMGCERRVIYDLINVIKKEANLKQTLIKDKRSKNLFILPASQTRDKESLTKEGVKEIILELSRDFDYIICDSPAGIEKGAILAMYYADLAIIVTNPEISSVRDSDRILGVLFSKTKKAKESFGNVKASLLITRYSPQRVSRGEMMHYKDVTDVLSIPLIGVIPESKIILQASNSGVPVTAFKNSDAGEAYIDSMNRFLGKKVPLRFVNKSKLDFFRNFFVRR